MRANSGVTIKEMTALGVPKTMIVSAAHSGWIDIEVVVPEARPPNRNCITCRKPFHSAGPHKVDQPL